MHTQYKLVFAVVAGIGLGAAVIEGLHAQAKPPTYVVVAIRSIKDSEAFKSDVVDKATPSAITAAGGRYIIRSQNVKSLDGPSPQRFVVLAFDSMDKAQAWQDSQLVKEVTAARIKSTDSSSFMVEGVAE
jgi:uncharacterized protein (DUF1330 family)